MFSFEAGPDRKPVRRRFRERDVLPQRLPRSQLVPGLFCQLRQQRLYNPFLFSFFILWGAENRVALQRFCAIVLFSFARGSRGMNRIIAVGNVHFFSLYFSGTCRRRAPEKNEANVHVPPSKEILTKMNFFASAGLGPKNR